MKENNLQKKIQESAHKMGDNIMRIRVNKGIDLLTASAASGMSIHTVKDIEEGKIQM